VDIPIESGGASDEIVILGNYSKSNYNATPIVSRYGIAPTVRENHGQVTGVIHETKMSK